MSMANKITKTCGNRLLCLATNLGCECTLTDHDVDPKSPACIDYIFDDQDLDE